VDGLNIDTVYENFVRQIAGDALQAKNNESLKESVEQDEKRQKLEKQIASLQAKVKKEKQLNKQVQLNAELKKLKKELEKI
jgi:translation elongation factor EF-Ts